MSIRTKSNTQPFESRGRISTIVGPVTAEYNGSSVKIQGSTATGIMAQWRGRSLPLYQTAGNHQFLSNREVYPTPSGRVIGIFIARVFISYKSTSARKGRKSFVKDLGRNYNVRMLEVKNGVDENETFHCWAVSSVSVEEF